MPFKKITFLPKDKDVVCFLLYHTNMCFARGLLRGFTIYLVILDKWLHFLSWGTGTFDIKFYVPHQKSPLFYFFYSHMHENRELKDGEIIGLPLCEF